MAPDKSLAAEIEAAQIIFEAIYPRLRYEHQSPENRKPFQRAAAALQSRAFEDGARWMRERAVEAAEASTPDCDGEIYIARKIADEIAALPLQPEGERNA